ncbi:YjbH domain-containing protein [Planctobacterium marinum]|uniref:Membrane protein n=1 Tax=Planctobacterium marinum TaxID=1631968 RepID=A0AA48HH20_9ALTE|nr:membrane protein [Planctobacterium marinum]
MKKGYLVKTSLALLFGSVSTAMADDVPRLNNDREMFSFSDLGGVGLLQTPTSRMMQDGDFTLGYKDNGEYRFWSASLQLFPWLETTVRYTDFRNLLYSSDPNFSGNQTAKDKGIDIKLKLLEESYWIPQLAVGFRDFGGTGFFESEYLTASKRFGHFDFHLGIGWGYLGNAGTISNPLCDIADRFCSRDEFGGFGVDQGGQLEVGDFFSGNASLIGGIEYQSPWQPLRFKVEYEGNDYTDERAAPLVQDSRWNFGINYLYEGFDFSLSWERGNTFGFGVNYTFNFHKASQYKVQPEKESLKERNPDLALKDVDTDELASKVSQSGIAVRDFRLEEDKFVVYGTRNFYRNQDEAIERIGRAIAQQVPDDIKTYHIVETNGAVPLVETVIDAEEFIAIANRDKVEDDLSVAYERKNPDPELMAKKADTEFTGFYGDMRTYWTQSFGSPEAFYLFQFGVYLNGGYAFNKHTTLNTNVRVNLLDNFDNFNFTVDAFSSSVPRVRTYVREYIQKSNVSVDSLFAHWIDNITDDIYVQAYGGYLETMYGGIGGEIYYQPVDSNIGFGVDLNYVKQRSFENDYDFRDYEAFTGHANIYWQPEFWEDVKLSFNVGQFLAKDKGVRFEFERKFDSGVTVGAYAAITDISAEEYGEGSFTKGFFISVPFDIFSLRPSMSRGRIPWSPISRDGGQPLLRPVQLHNLTSARSPFVD